jgi:hypothetical protein
MRCDLEIFSVRVRTDVTGGGLFSRPVPTVANLVTVNSTVASKRASIDRLNPTATSKRDSLIGSLKYLANPEVVKGESKRLKTSHVRSVKTRAIEYTKHPNESFESNEGTTRKRPEASEKRFSK